LNRPHPHHTRSLRGESKFMSWKLAPSLDTLRKQVNALWPDRSKASDGSVADLRHMSAGTSDHIPNKRDDVTAIDVTNDPAKGCDSRKLAEALVASKDPRIKYVISNGQICSSKVSPWQWRRYTGANGHFHHCHISVDPDPKLYNDPQEWSFPAFLSPTSHPDVQSKPVLRRGSVGASVVEAQNRLIFFKWLALGGNDGRFGPQTEAAVKVFQRWNGLPESGVVDKATWQKLLS
jgi:peptidoglycan hydrolase-like protein with peptidoglycan-binding domain